MLKWKSRLPLAAVVCSLAFGLAAVAGAQDVTEEPDPNTNTTTRNCPYPEPYVCPPPPPDPDPLPDPDPYPYPEYCPLDNEVDLYDDTPDLGEEGEPGYPHLIPGAEYDPADDDDMTVPPASNYYPVCADTNSDTTFSYPPSDSGGGGSLPPVAGSIAPRIRSGWKMGQDNCADFTFKAAYGAIRSHRLGGASTVYAQVDAQVDCANFDGRCLVVVCGGATAASGNGWHFIGFGRETWDGDHTDRSRRSRDWTTCDLNMGAISYLSSNQNFTAKVGVLFGPNGAGSVTFNDNGGKLLGTSLQADMEVSCKPPGVP